MGWGNWMSADVASTCLIGWMVMGWGWIPWPPSELLDRSRPIYKRKRRSEMNRCRLVPVDRPWNQTLSCPLISCSSSSQSDGPLAPPHPPNSSPPSMHELGGDEWVGVHRIDYSKGFIYVSVIQNVFRGTQGEAARVQQKYFVNRPLYLKLLGFLKLTFYSWINYYLSIN